jgi:hypothetical protein
VLNKKLPYDLIIGKISNSTGLQIADLKARPIGIKILRPQQPNRAYEIIKTILRKSPTEDVKVAQTSQNRQREIKGSAEPMGDLFSSGTLELC